jgi:hypothetical protein
MPRRDPKFHFILTMLLTVSAESLARQPVESRRLALSEGHRDLGVDYAVNGKRPESATQPEYLDICHACLRTLRRPPDATAVSPLWE